MHHFWGWGWLWIHILMSVSKLNCWTLLVLGLCKQTRKNGETTAKRSRNCIYFNWKSVLYPFGILLHVPDYRGLRLPSHRLEKFLWQYTATDRIEFLPVPSINNYKYNVFSTDENMCHSWNAQNGKEHKGTGTNRRLFNRVRSDLPCCVGLLLSRVR